MFSFSHNIRKRAWWHFFSGQHFSKCSSTVRSSVIHIVKEHTFLEVTIDLKVTLEVLECVVSQKSFFMPEYNGPSRGNILGQSLSKHEFCPSYFCYAKFLNKHFPFSVKSATQTGNPCSLCKRRTFTSFLEYLAERKCREFWLRQVIFLFQFIDHKMPHHTRFITFISHHSFASLWSTRSDSQFSLAIHFVPRPSHEKIPLVVYGPSTIKNGFTEDFC